MGKQLRLFKSSQPPPCTAGFGGSLLNGRRKSKRPLNFKRSHHIVLKSAAGFSLLRHRQVVTHVLEKYSARFSIKIYSVAVHCDHIHLCLKIDSREAYVKWIRSVTSRLVGLVKGFRFTLRPWSRIVEWGRAFKHLQEYITTNRLEAEFIAKAWDLIERVKNRFALEGGLETGLIAALE